MHGCNPWSENGVPADTAAQSNGAIGYAGVHVHKAGYRANAMSNKAVTQMTDPEYTVEFDGKETYVMRNGVKLAMRRDDRWVSIEPGITVRDIVENGRHGIEVRMTVH
jgi:hypothetical protein